MFEKRFPDWIPKATYGLGVNIFLIVYAEEMQKNTKKRFYGPIGVIP